MMPTCRRCGTAYMQSKSMSALVLTYCGVLCETADLGFSLLALERLELAATPTGSLQRRNTVAAAVDAGRSMVA